MEIEKNHITKYLKNKYLDWFVLEKDFKDEYEKSDKNLIKLAHKYNAIQRYINTKINTNELEINISKINKQRQKYVEDNFYKAKISRDKEQHLEYFKNFYLLSFDLNITHGQREREYER